jgi:hypothetical protein
MSGIRIEACPVAERYDCIWLWTGDKVATDEADIPDMSGDEGGIRACPH